MKYGIYLMIVVGAVLASGFPAQVTGQETDSSTVSNAAKFMKKANRRVPDGTTVLRDLAYVTDGHERHKLDLYVPPHTDPIPLVVWVHGGAWRAGDKGNPRGLMPLLEGGFAVASINYRLSRHAEFPAQIFDCKAAIRWLRSEATTHGYDPQRIGAWGASAGGHLAALIGTTGKRNEFERGSHIDQSSAVQAVCVWFGPTDFSRMNVQAGSKGTIDHDAADSPESMLIGGAVQRHLDGVRAANPVTYVTRDVPPMLIMHGDRDFTVPIQQGELLVDALRKVDADVMFQVVQGGGHGFAGQARELEPRVVKFFQEHLGRS